MSKLPKTKEEITAYCGLECEGCEFVESHGCNGCIATRGRPFHISEGQGPCAVAKCAMEHEVIFCGECGEFPCQLLESFSYDQEHGDDGARIQRCRDILAALQKGSGEA